MRRNIKYKSHFLSIENRQRVLWVQRLIISDLPLMAVSLLPPLEDQKPLSKHHYCLPSHKLAFTFQTAQQAYLL